MVEIRERERPLADERSWVKRVSWGAIFAGVFVVLGVQLILSMFGLAIGFGAVDPAQETAPFSGIGWGAGIWWIITAILSMFLGGWSAGRLAGIPRRPSAILHGVVVWSLATLLTLWLATSAIGRVTSGAVGIVGETAGLLGTAVTEAAGAVGGAAQAVAPEVTNAVQQALQAQGASLESIRQQARQLLGLADGAPEDITAEAQQAFNRLSQILGALFAPGGDQVTEAEIQEAATILANNTDLSEAEAQQLIQGWQQQAQQAMQQVQQTLQQAQQTALQTAGTISDVLAAAAWWGFFAMLIGIAAAGAGAAAGAPKET